MATRKWINVAKDPDLKVKSLAGKTIVITGANTGLGRSLAFDLAKRGAENIILACRNVAKGDDVVRDIIKSTGNLNVKCMSLDLASLDSIREFVASFLKDHAKLDCLVCNAGVWVPMEQGQKTADGFEIHFGVNHLGHFLLVKLLQDCLQQSTECRVVVVSSGLMNAGVVDMNNIDVYNGRKANPNNKDKRISFAPTGYCDSKLMNGLFAKELANRCHKIKAVAVGPGWCKTDLARHVRFPIYKKMFMLPFMLMFMRSSNQGADNIIYTVIQDVAKLENGGFYRDGKTQKKENY